eukprot:TRINITY_DN3327_c0_g1_i3.p1 TRINITY_DN3327_c0_g1~~TRINITY_DN3327_c0_g1_i3.p1  ORF type:complete len:214 (-),score=37.65 TRINITY_DN3327_c0_g1_i3:129-770(-)
MARRGWLVLLMLATVSCIREPATFAAGCFWSVENVFQRVPGVLATEVGYTGGEAASPRYETVMGGDTGHAEAVRVWFEPSVVSYRELLDVFFETHDPTQTDGQGNDIGTQYRSGIFTHGEQQQAAAELAKAKHQQRYARPIVTALAPASEWWVAEAYHQQYLQLQFRHSADKGSLAPIQCYGSRGPIKRLDKMLSPETLKVLTRRTRSNGEEL